MSGFFDLWWEERLDQSETFGYTIALTDPKASLVLLDTIEKWRDRQFRVTVIEDGKLLPSMTVLWLCPLFCIAYGYALQYGLHLGVVLLFHGILGFSQSIFMPPLMNYISAVRAANNGSAGACMFFICFGFSAVSISFSIQAVEAIGYGAFFLILALISMVSLLWSTVYCCRRVMSGTSK